MSETGVLIFIGCIIGVAVLGAVIAVIAAAIAAAEGTTTDGFVVRSIRKVNRRKR